MANKIAKLTMLSMLFSTMLGLGLTSGVSNQVASPIKQTVSYASEDNLNNHDTSHSSDYSWTPLTQSDFDNAVYANGYIRGGYSENAMSYYYLQESIKFDIRTIGYVTLCLNGKTLEGTGNGSVITNDYLTLNLCDCSEDGNGTVTGGDALYGGGIRNYETFNMYGGTITGNTATRDGGGVGMNDTRSIFNMYGGTISNNTATRNGGGVSKATGGTFNMYGGTITNNEASYGDDVYGFDNVTFNIYEGIISNNKADISGVGVYLDDVTFNVYGGYVDGGIYNYNSSVSLAGGYFSPNAYSDIDNSWIATGYQIIDISLIGSDLDENYVAGYPYAVYATSTTSYSVSDVTDVTYGSTYTPTINTDSTLYTSVAYTYKDIDDNEISGLPTSVGEYTVTAHFLYTTTEGYITTNSYGTTEFKVTITSSVTETPEEEEEEEEEEGESGEQDNTSDGNSDNNTTNGDTTTTNDDSIGLSAGTIAGIVIGSVLVIGVIAFLVYFLFFRKRNKNGSK